MYKLFSALIINIFISTSLLAEDSYLFEPSDQHPYGLFNPKAPEQLKDYEKLIGQSHCQSIKKSKDQQWGDEVKMIWTFKYILNGNGVQDFTLKEDGTHSGSIRLYDTENKHWQIHYYSSVVNSKAQNLKMWTGVKKGNDLVYYRESKAPNGTEGYYRLSFKDITDKSFNWIGEWVDTNETMSFPTWKISCKKSSFKE